VDDDTAVPDPAFDAAELADPGLPPDESERTSPIPVLVTLFVILLLAIVLIAATSDPYGAGCGGG
jgi:hypothetical protein